MEGEGSFASRAKYRIPPNFPDLLCNLIKRQRIFILPTYHQNKIFLYLIIKTTLQVTHVGLYEGTNQVSRKIFIIHFTSYNICIYNVL